MWACGMESLYVGFVVVEEERRFWGGAEGSACDRGSERLTTSALLYRHVRVVHSYGSGSFLGAIIDDKRIGKTGLAVTSHW